MFIKNTIPQQNKDQRDSISNSEWNTIVNQLSTQTNLNSLALTDVLEGYFYFEWSPTKDNEKDINLYTMFTFPEDSLGNKVKTNEEFAEYLSSGANKETLEKFEANKWKYYTMGYITDGRLLKVTSRGYSKISPEFLEDFIKDLINKNLKNIIIDGGNK